MMKSLRNAYLRSKLINRQSIELYRLTILVKIASLLLQKLSLA